jgi:hypothetical protein
MAAASTGWVSTDDDPDFQDRTVYLEGISHHLRDRLTTQTDIINWVEKIGKKFEEKIEEIKHVDRGQGKIRVVFSDNEPAEHLQAMRTVQIEGTNNQNKKPITDTVRIRWHWKKRARQASEITQDRFPVYTYVDPKDYMLDGITGHSGDEDELEKNLVLYLGVPEDTKAQLIKRPGSFLLYFRLKSTQQDLLSTGSVRTNPNKKIRAIYQVQERKMRNDESGARLNKRTLNAHSATYISPSTQNESRQNVTATTATTSSTTPVSTTPISTTASNMRETVSTTSSFTGIDEEKISTMVKHVVEATMHAFIGQQNLQIQQVTNIQQQASIEHERKMERMENMLMGLISRQQNVNYLPYREGTVNLDNLAMVTPDQKIHPKPRNSPKSRDSESDISEQENSDSVSSEESDQNNPENEKKSLVNTSSPSTLTKSSDIIDKRIGPEDKQTPKRKATTSMTTRKSGKSMKSQHPIKTYLTDSKSPRTESSADSDEERTSSSNVSSPR